MIGSEMICFPTPGSRRRKVALLLACWLVEGIVWLVIFGSPIPAVVPHATRDCAFEGSTPQGKNETGAFFARRSDPAAGHRPMFSVGWKNMRAENGRVGVFRTPLSRTIFVDGLVIESHQYSRGAEDRREQPPLVQTMCGLGRQLKEGFAGMEIEGPLADISHAAKVVVRGLDYSLIRDGQLELSIKCRSAVASLPGPEIILRGGVTVKALDGAALTSNCVVWDAQTNHFSVPGAYTLNDNGVLVSGRGVRCDQRLCPSVAQGAYDTKGAGKWVEGRLF